MKKFLRGTLAVVLVFAALLLFHALNTNYPENIINRFIQGAFVVITPVLIALVIMYLINPFAQKLINKNISKKLAIAITMAIFGLVLIIVITLTTVFLVDKGVELYTTITKPEFLATVEDWFNKHNIYPVYQYIMDYLSELDWQIFVGGAGSLAKASIQFLAAIILVPIFLWHFMNTQEQVMGKINDNIPHKWRKNVVPIIEDANAVTVAYFRSKLLSMIVLFLMFLILYFFMGLPIGYVFLFSILISILDLVPYIGPTVGMIIPIIFLFSINGTNLFYNPSWHVNGVVANIILIVINFVFQFIQGNIIIPKLAGKEMEINSAIILVFMLFFGYILGVWGIVLSIPLGGILLVLWKHLKSSGFFNNE